MRYWRQIKHFGVGEQQSNWFVSLLQRLATLCECKLEEFLSDSVAKDALRFHEIDWGGKNVPVKREDFDWLPQGYRDNPDEYPFYQFHISKALGRVIGFFDENQVFNVVALDPMHNMQPSQYNDYKVRPTKIGECQFTALVAVAQETVGACGHHGCTRKLELAARLESEVQSMSGGMVVCRLTDDHHERFRSLRGQGHAEDISEIFELGLTVYEETYTVAT